MIFEKTHNGMMLIRDHWQVNNGYHSLGVHPRKTLVVGYLLTIAPLEMESDHENRFGADRMAAWSIGQANLKNTPQNQKKHRG